MKQAHAFSLVELMMVVTIALTLCLIAIPHMITPTDYQLSHELERLRVTIMLLQQHAIACSQEKIMFFDTTTHSYWFEKNGHKTVFFLPTTCRFDYIKGMLGPPAQPHRPIGQAITLPQHPQQKNVFSLKLLPNGNFSAGSIYILDKNTGKVGALTCPLSQVFYIRKYLYKPPRWQIVTR